MSNSKTFHSLVYSSSSAKLLIYKKKIIYVDNTEKKIIPKNSAFKADNKLFGKKDSPNN
jgi:hypothetical protein